MHPSRIVVAPNTRRSGGEDVGEAKTRPVVGRGIARANRVPVTPKGKVTATSTTTRFGGKKAGASRGGKAFGPYRPVVHRNGKTEAVTRALAAAVVSRATLFDMERVVDAVGSVEAVVDRMFDSVPGANHLDEQLGPFYDTAGLRRWKQVSRQALDAQVQRGDLLAVITSDDHRLYPQFQFGGRDGALAPRLRDVLALLDPGRRDLWGDALWLNTPMTDLDEKTPATALHEGLAEQVLPLARSAGRIWLR